MFIGIDNGVTGTIGIVGENEPFFTEVPVKKEQNYTKRKDIITRIDVCAFADILRKAAEGLRPDEVFVGIERPMINPKFFASTVSAARAFEAELCTVESLGYGFMFLDSKEWQKSLLPQGVKGSSEQKSESMDIACRLFPSLGEQIRKHKDGDGILIAEHLRRNIR